MPVITVLSDLAPDERTYVATVQLDGDTARTLNRDQGYAWASTVLAAATRAEHDALILLQLTQTIGLDLDLAASCIADLREDRPPLDDDATAPLRLVPGVTAKLKPFLAVHINGTQAGQWTCADARQHAAGVLEVLTAVDLDAAYHRFLISTLDIDPDTARAVVSSLLQLRTPEADAEPRPRWIDSSTLSYHSRSCLTCPYETSRWTEPQMADQQIEEHLAAAHPEADR